MGNERCNRCTFCTHRSKAKFSENKNIVQHSIQNCGRYACIEWKLCHFHTAKHGREQSCACHWKKRTGNNSKIISRSQDCCIIFDVKCHDLFWENHTDHSKQYRNADCQYQVQIKTSSNFRFIFLTNVLRNHNSCDSTDRRNQNGING